MLKIWKHILLQPGFELLNHGLQGPAWPGKAQAPVQSLHGLCKTHAMCVIWGDLTACPVSPEKRLGITSKKIVLVSNPITSDSKFKPPRAQHHLLGLLVQLFLLQLLFLFHPKRAFDRALYKTASNHSHLGLRDSTSSRATSCHWKSQTSPKYFASRANLPFSSDPLFHCVVVCWFSTLLALWGAHHPGSK